MRSVTFFCLAIILGSHHAFGGERVFDFTKYPPDKKPPGFRSVLSGTGQPGEWKVIRNPAALRTASAESPASGEPEQVLAQLAQEAVDEHFPMLLFDEESYGDFTLTTRLKLISGSLEQMGGIAFRVRDTNNYYYVRASALGDTFRFIKLVNGQRLTTLGPSTVIATNVWHELTVECRGSRLRCLLNGKELIPPLVDTTFSAGQIAFWTKSDSVVHFGHTKIVYTPRESLAQTVLKEAMSAYPRLSGLRIYAHRSEEGPPKVIASTHEDEIGLGGTNVEQDVIARDVMYQGKRQQVALVTLPLHDRNGEVLAAVRVVLRSFPGQTEANALARAQPVVKFMEERLRSASDLFQ